MKTTLELPDDLMRAVRIRAVQQDRKLTDLIADLLRRGLAETEMQPDRAPRRVSLPLVRCAHPARAEEEVTPERAAEILLHQEAADALAG